MQLQKVLRLCGNEVTSVSSSILAPSACRSASNVSKGVFPDLSSVRGQKEKQNVLKVKIFKQLYQLNTAFM